MFSGYKTKQNPVIVFTGEGKGKTSASLGLTVRALGAGLGVAYIQFIKGWRVSEHEFFKKIEPVFKGNLTIYQGGKGFYGAGDLSAKNVSEEEHKKVAIDAYNKALRFVKSSRYDLVICDEINNAVHSGLLAKKDLEQLINARSIKTSLCLTGRYFPKEFLSAVNIATDMKKLKHHFDNKFLANKGIDY